MPSVAISQPTYLPWLGYFAQIAKADYFVFLDTVQYQKQSWQSRNRLKDLDDRSVWLSVPVADHRISTAIKDIRIAAQKVNWQRKHINSLRTCLGKTPHLAQVVGLVESVFEEGHTHLADLHVAMITAVCTALGIRTRLLRASQLGVEGKRTELLLEIIRKLGCNRYLANTGSCVYLDNDGELFRQAGVTVSYQDWQHPAYQQRGARFVSHLAWPDPVSYLGFSAERLGILRQ